MAAAIDGTGLTYDLKSVNTITVNTDTYNLESITNAKLILENFPDSNKIADAHILLGSNYFKLNDFGQAEYHWMYVIENYESSKISRKAIEKLKSLNIENN